MRPRGSVAGPLVLIAIGILFLMHSIAPEFRVTEIFSRYWPYFLIFWGVAQLIEISIRALRNAPIPANGISAGGWVVVLLICCAGFSMFEFQRPDTWWRQAGFERSLDMFGQEHQYSLAPSPARGRQIAPSHC